MANVNSINPLQAQSNISTAQEIEKTNVQAAQHHRQLHNTASSTHNLYHNNNLLGNQLFDHNVTQRIINNARLDKTLNERILSINNNHTTAGGVPMPPLDLLDDMHKKLMGLQSNGHLRNLMRSFYRRAKKGQSTDQSFGSSNIKEEYADLSEKEKVKRKEGQVINENTINDVITEGLRRGNIPDTSVQRFLLLNMAVQDTKDDKEFNKAAVTALENLYKNHGVEIRAKINSLDEAFEYSKNGAEPKKLTQFHDTYYALIQTQNIQQMFAIFAACKDTMEFDKLTNLMNGIYSSSVKDKQGVNLPTSDPNTIHSVLTFMHLKTAIISLMKSADKFIFALNKPKGKGRFGGDLLTHVHPKAIF